MLSYADKTYWQAAPGNVSTRELPKRCSIVQTKQRAVQVFATSGVIRGSRLPTKSFKDDDEYEKERARSTRPN